MKLIEQLQTASKHKLNINKLYAIALLSQSSRRINELAKIIKISPAAMTGMIDSMKIDHIAKRVRSEKDRRIINIVLTDKGKGIASEIM
jgi:DNA-binding MarR family transcriptional regulator